jgi:hypothetical protein
MKGALRERLSLIDLHHSPGGDRQHKMQIEGGIRAIRPIESSHSVV